MSSRHKKLAIALDAAYEYENSCVRLLRAAILASTSTTEAGLIFNNCSTLLRNTTLPWIPSPVVIENTRYKIRPVPSS